MSQDLKLTNQRTENVVLPVFGNLRVQFLCGVCLQAWLAELGGKMLLHVHSHKELVRITLKAFAPHLPSNTFLGGRRSKTVSEEEEDCLNQETRKVLFKCIL